MECRRTWTSWGVVATDHSCLRMMMMMMSLVFVAKAKQVAFKARPVVIEADFGLPFQRATILGGIGCTFMVSSWFLWSGEVRKSQGKISGSGKVREFYTPKSGKT